MHSEKRVLDANGLVPVTGQGPAFVGALWRNQHADMMHPADYCLDDGMLYVGAVHRLGRVNVFGVDSELETLASAQAVIVYGQREASLLSALRQSGPCPDEEMLMAQMRSDWIADEGGYQTTRARLAELPYIQGQGALGVTLYEVVDMDDKNVRVRVRNPFDAPYSDISLVVHYEGGPGKPMPHYQSQLLSLEPGAAVELGIARSADPDGTRPRTKAGWGLHSIQLRGRAGDAEIDADLIVPHQ